MNIIIIFFLIINLFNNTYSGDFTENKTQKCLSGKIIKKPTGISFKENKRYSEEDKKNFLKLKKEGISAKEIAEKLNIKVKTIYHWLKNKKTSKEYKRYSKEDKKNALKLKEEGLSIYKIEELTKISHSTLAFWIKKENPNQVKKYDPETITKILAFAEEKKYNNEISEALKLEGIFLTRSQIKYIKSKYQLTEKKYNLNSNTPNSNTPNESKENSESEFEFEFEPNELKFKISYNNDTGFEIKNSLLKTKTKISPESLTLK